MKFLHLLLWFLAAAALGGLLALFACRLTYPYDLEWMEGGMLCHALRLLEGKPLYPPPSLEFIPYLYTPLYPTLLAGLAQLFALSYPLARGLSVASTLAALLLGFLFVRREGSSTTAALVAVALPAAAFVPTGAWYDLARPDALFLALITAALVTGWWGRRSHLGGAAAAALMVAAFLAKQTATPFMLALVLALWLAQRRVALTYLAVLAALGLPLLLWLDRASDGWFWTYVFRLHQAHSFRPVRGFLAAPGLILLLLGPALLLLPWAMRRARSDGLVFAIGMGLTGLLVACLGYGTQWSFVNAIIPGVFFLSLATGVAAGRLLSRPPGSSSRQTPILVLAALALTLALFAPNGLARLLLPVVPASWKMAPRAFTGYAPRPFLPAAADRQAGAVLLARLRQARGEVLVPHHPYYAYLAGKRPFLHGIGLLDTGPRGQDAIAALARALAARRFSLVVLDDIVEGDWGTWPGLLAHYRVVEHLEGPRMISGTPMRTRYLLAPLPR